MFENQQNKDCDSSNKKNNTSAAVIAALVTFGSSTGLLGLFGIFGDEHDDRGGRVLNVPATRQFISEGTAEQVVDLRGDWRFSTGDDVAWASGEWDDSEWGTIEVPSTWEKAGYEDYDGFAWYRKSFSIGSTDTERSLYLYLGRVDDVDEVYVNGESLGGRGRLYPDYLTAWNQNRVYRLPSEILRADHDNVIAVRVYDDQQGGGIVQGPVGIFASELPQPLLDLAGKWGFRLGDDASWSGGGDDGFTPVQVPLVWEANGYEDYDGYAWYRKRFGPVPHEGEETLALVLGRIDDTDEVFLNGERIGKTGELDGKDQERNSNFWRMERIYEFPARLLGDENLLTVRVHDSTGSGGIYSGPVGIMRIDDVRRAEEIEPSSGAMTWGEVWRWLIGQDK